MQSRLFYGGSEVSGVMTKRVTLQVGLAELYKYRDKTDTILLFFGVVRILIGPHLSK